MVKPDATTRGVLIHPWLARWERVYFETEDHPYKRENGYKIQWTNIKNDLKRTFELPQLAPKLAYVFGALVLTLYKSWGIPVEVLIAGAVGYDTATDVGTVFHPGTSTTISLSHTATGTNRIASIGTSSYRIGGGDVDTATATYGGSACTQAVVKADPASVEGQLTMLYFIAPSTSSATVEVTYSAGVHVGWLGVSTFTGAAQSSPVGDTDTASNGGDVTTINVTTTSGDAVSSCCIAGTTAANLSATGTGEVQVLEEEETGWATYGMSYILADGTSEISVWTCSDSAANASAAWVILQAATTNISKISGVSYSGVSKVNGIAKASIGKVMGIT